MKPAATPDPLAGLKDIHLPAEPGWWPPAIGWWLLALAALLALAGLAWWLWRSHRRRAPLREALAALDALPAGEAQLPALNHLLRRAARQRYGPAAAAQPAADWARFLAETAPPDSRPELWAQLAEAAYRPQPPAVGDDVLEQSRRWLRHNLAC